MSEPVMRRSSASGRQHNDNPVSETESRAMLPFQLDASRIRVVVVGRGAAIRRKIRTVLAAGNVSLTVYSDDRTEIEQGPSLDVISHLPDNLELSAAKFVVCAGLETNEAHDLAERCRAMQVLVNVEDCPELCDFYMPAVVRRGDLTLAISTNGRAPGLSGIIRQHLESMFPSVWEDRIGEIARYRNDWRAAGHDQRTVKNGIANLVKVRSWFNNDSGNELPRAD